MSELSPGSVSLWLEQLKTGDDDAARQLWGRYFKRLATLARKRLKNGSPDADEDDVALSALKSVFLAVRDDRYENLNHRTELWSLLVAITVRKATNQVKRQYAQKRTPLAEDREKDAANLVGTIPSPECRVEIAEELERLLNRLDDDLMRTITILRLEGHTVPEIATKMQRSERTIARKLTRIRQEWAEALF